MFCTNVYLEIFFYIFFNYGNQKFVQICHFQCRNPSLGLATKARACKGVGQVRRPGVTFHVPGNVGECEGMNPTLPNEPPL